MSQPEKTAKIIISSKPSIFGANIASSENTAAPIPPARLRIPLIAPAAASLFAVPFFSAVKEIKNGANAPRTQQHGNNPSAVQKADSGKAMQ
ncbi:MAG: hypothetical protein LUF33_01035 [Clostridiales bacterium]|nr:hypothetical protein [Clostridiales bacterium]